MRWWVAGAGGMLGQDLVEVLRSAGEDVVPATQDDADVTVPSSVAAALDAAGDVDVVVNCTAWTAVDDAETHESAAFAVNAVGPQILARAAAERGARIVHVSTDYVFDGTADRPYAAGELVAPRSAYGRTKAAGEWAVRVEAPDHLVVRTAWLYGAKGNNFPRTIARVLRERGRADVVDDEIGQPTWTRDLARLVLDLVRAGAASGVYHGTSAGQGSWYEFAREVAASIGMDPDVVGRTSASAYGRPAPRPAWSVLSQDEVRAVGVEPIGDWRSRWAAASSSVLTS